MDILTDIERIERDHHYHILIGKKVLAFREVLRRARKASNPESIEARIAELRGYLEQQKKLTGSGHSWSREQIDRFKCDSPFFQETKARGRQQAAFIP